MHPILQIVFVQNGQCIKELKTFCPPTNSDNLTKIYNLCMQIICLGDSAVGKSKLVERFLLDGQVAMLSPSWWSAYYQIVQVVLLSPSWRSTYSQRRWRCSVQTGGALPPRWVGGNAQFKLVEQHIKIFTELCHTYYTKLNFFNHLPFIIKHSNTL